MGSKEVPDSGETWVEESLLRTCLEHAHQQRSRLADFSTRDFPFPGCLFLVKILGLLLDLIMERLSSDIASLRTAPNDPDVLQDAEIEPRRFALTLSLLHEVLELLEVSNREHISQGSVYFLDEITWPFRNNSRFILYPSYTYNYSYADILNFITKISSSIRVIGLTGKSNPANFEAITKKVGISVISFPMIYRDNAMSHCMVAHETGHYFVESRKIISKLPEGVLDSKLIEKAIASYRAGPSLRRRRYLARERLRTSVIDDALTMVENWRTELAADLFAFRSLGPVFIFVAANFFLSINNLDYSTDTHPSTRIRLRFLLKNFQDSGFAGILGDSSNHYEGTESTSSYFNELRNMIERPIETQFAITDEFEKAMRELVDDAISKSEDNIIKTVDEDLLTLKYPICSSDSFLHGTIIGYKDLLEFVPPCEESIGKPARLASILNASMMFIIKGKESYLEIWNRKDIGAEMEIEDKINDLIMKGIESSYLERKFSK